MTHVVKVARNGAITIPAEIRKKYGIDDGSYLGIEEAGEDIRLVRVRIEKESFIKAVEEMARIADKKGITRKDVIKASKKAGKDIYAEEFRD
jgi:AbrB family looped-hinge helix DNA binding protein